MIAFVIQKRADGPNASIHHVGRCDHVRARLDVRQGRTLQQLQGQIVDNVLPLHDTTMAVISILAQAHVRNHHQGRHGLLEGAHGLLHSARRAVRFLPQRIFGLWQAKQQHRRYPMVYHAPGLLHSLIHREVVLPWHRGDFLAYAMPWDHE